MSATGVLPPGVQAGGLGGRFVAYLIDGLVPAVLVAVAAVVMFAQGLDDPAVGLVLGIAVGIVVLGWSVLSWWMLATRGATPGMALMKLQFVGLRDGRPVGWGRALLRILVLNVLVGSSVGAIVVVITILTNIRNQGVHDQVAQGVVIKRRHRPATAPAAGPMASPSQVMTGQVPSGATPVGLPAHLQVSAGFAPGGQQWSGAGYAADQAAYGRPPSAGSAPSATDPPVQQAMVQPPAAWNGPSAGAGPITQVPDFGSAQPGTPGPVPAAAPQSYPAAAHPQSYPAAAHPQAQPAAAPQSYPVPSQPPSEAVAGFGAVPAGAPAFGPTAGNPVAGDPASGGPAAGGAAEPLDDGTRIIPRVGARAPDQGWTITLDDGRTVAVASLVLIGRNPQPRPSETGAELVVMGEAARTVSKTHVAVGVDNRGIWISDRGSTNGSAIATGDGQFEPCQPGEVVRVREGQVVTFGEHRFQIRRSGL